MAGASRRVRLDHPIIIISELRMVQRLVRTGILAALMAAVSGTSALAQAVVSVSPATKNVLPTGGNFVLTVNIANATNVHAYQVVLSFNNAVIRYVGRAEGSFLNGGGLYGTFFQSNPPPSASVSSITFDSAILGIELASGDGTLFTVTFAPVANGASPVTISSVDLRDDNNNALPATIQSGSVTVTNPAAVYVDPTYTQGNSGGHDFGFDAFTSFASGATAVGSGGTINLAPATYNETVTLTRSMTIAPTSGLPVVLNLTQNSPSVTLAGNIQVSGTLTLTSGVLSTGSNKVVVSNSSPGAVVIANGAVAGELERQIAALSTQTYLFTDLNTLLVPDGTQSALTASVRSFPNTAPPFVETGAAINRYYSITTSGTLAATVRLAYLDGEINGINESVMTIFRYSGVAWVPITSDPSPANNYVEGIVVPIGSTLWTIGDRDNPLPIQLASFTGTLVGNGSVRLDWVTVSEINNFGFYVQRKRPVEQTYTELTEFIPGNGTTNETHSYTLTDTPPGEGSWMYRLKQVDLNGPVHYTEPITVNGVTSVKNSEVPLVFALKQNYPNPFNPSTTIEYVLPKSGYTTLKIFNLLGQEVASLVDGVVEAGRHSLKWDATGLPSSLYLCKLTSGGSVETRKLILAK